MTTAAPEGFDNDPGIWAWRPDLTGVFLLGDTIDALTGAPIVGPYCEWPRRTRPVRQFAVQWGGRQGGKRWRQRVSGR